jgi:hypothetical protein
MLRIPLPSPPLPLPLPLPPTIYLYLTQQVRTTVASTSGVHACRTRFPDKEIEYLLGTIVNRKTPFSIHLARYSGTVHQKYFTISIRTVGTVILFLRSSSDYCSSPLFRKETLSGDFTVL